MIYITATKNEAQSVVFFTESIFIF